MRGRGRLFLLLAGVLLIVVLSRAITQGQTASWAKTYGTSGDAVAYSIQETTDGGYIVGGRTVYSYPPGGGTVEDLYVLKIDAEGNKLWENTRSYIYAGGYTYSAVQTIDGNYILAGVDIGYGAGWGPINVSKIDGHGNIVWSKSGYSVCIPGDPVYGGGCWSGNFSAVSLEQTNDNGCIITATATLPAWNGGYYSGIYILKLDESGTEMWNKFYKEDWGHYYASSIKKTTDGGYIVSGHRKTFGCAIYILKLDPEGNKLWSRNYGIGYDMGSPPEFSSVSQTIDGGYIVAGTIEGDDFYVIKLNDQGNIIWEKEYGGSGDDQAYSIQQTFDGGYIVTGATTSFGAGGKDIYIIKLDDQGNEIWSKTYGGVNDDWAHSIQQTSDGGYIVAGATKSLGATDFDFWILKLDANGNLLLQPHSLSRPVEGKVTCPFHGYIKNGKLHEGIDIDGDSQGKNVIAAAPGKVVYVDRVDDSPAGKWVWIEHGEISKLNGTSVPKISTRYLHLETIDPNVTQGKTIAQGTVIGTVGNTGCPNSVSHLHFEVRKGDIPANLDYRQTIALNPQDFIQYTTYPSIFFVASCPVDLTITDPHGFIVSKELNQIPMEAQYIEVRYSALDDEEENLQNYDAIVVYDPKIGNYFLTVIPEPNAQPDDVYNLCVTTDDQTMVLAQNVPIANIPTEPCEFESKLNRSDFDNDGDVDFYDYAAFASRWMNADCHYPDWCEGTDLDYSGHVDFMDLSIFTENWLWEKIPADFDIDGAVNFTDYAIFAYNWMDDTCCDPNWCEGTDFDHSGSVDMLDLATFARYWLEGI